MAVIPNNKITATAAKEYKQPTAKEMSANIGEIASVSRLGTIPNNNAAKAATPHQSASPQGEGSSGITPTAPSNNAMTQNVNQAAAKSVIGDGMIGIRDTLNKRGIADSRIGWNADTKYMTLDGKDTYKPTSIVDGVSYAPQGDIDRITNAAYESTGNPIVGTTGYVAEQGLANAVTWNDGNLLIGGHQVPVVYVKDGKAYAKKSDVDNAISLYREQSGVRTNRGVYDSWYDQYGDRIDDALDRIENRDEWEYDMESDPAYQAYKEAYMREGNRAYQNAVARLAANTGGYGSSAAVTAGGQQLNYYMQQLNDRVPELMRDSHSRYMDEQSLNRAALDAIMGVADSNYNKQYQANRDSISDTNTANYYNYMRDMGARDYNRQLLTEDREWDITKRGAELSLQEQALSNILSKYSYSGDMNRRISAEDAQIAGIAPNSDGTYPTIKEILDAYARLQASGEYINWTDNGKKQTIETKKINDGIY